MGSPQFSSEQQLKYWLERLQGAWREVKGRVTDLTSLVTEVCGEHSLICDNKFAEYNKCYMELEYLLITHILDMKEHKSYIPTPISRTTRDDEELKDRNISTFPGTPNSSSSVHRSPPLSTSANRSSNSRKRLADSRSNDHVNSHVGK